MGDLFDRSELIVQEGGRADAPPLVYVPGIHGDWTPLRRSRGLFHRRARLIEVAYPRQSRWRLRDYAESMDRMMNRLNLKSAHFAVESFGSLVGWQYLLTRPERVRSIVVVGGFTHSPGKPKVFLAQLGLRSISPELFEKGMEWYCSRLLHSSNAQAVERGVDRRELDPATLYPAARTPDGWRTIISRLSLIQNADFRPYLNRVRTPVRYLGGASDMVVPVHREVRTLWSGLTPRCRFASALVPDAPHMVIASHPRGSTERICDWIEQVEAGAPGLG